MAKKWQRPEEVARVSAWAEKFIQGDRLEGLFVIDNDHAGNAQVSSRRQPEILVGYERAGSTLRRAVTWPFKLAAGGTRSSSDTRRRSSREEREELRQHSTSLKPSWMTACWQFGSRESLSGSLLVATQPKSKTRYLSFLTVSDKHLLLLHVQDAFRSDNFAKVAELAWQIDRRSIEWTRDTRRKGQTGGFQLGFVDGSWLTISGEPALGYPDFTKVFPGSFTSTQLVPPA